MYKRVVFILFCFVIFIFCITTIHAVDVNVSNLNNTDYNDSSIQKENKTQIEDFNLNETRNQTELSSQSTNIYYGGSYNVILKDRNTSNPIANKNVSFVINNFNYFATTDNEGVASITLNLNPNKYLVFAYFVGDDTYQNCSLTNTIEVLSTIKADDITKFYKGTTPFSVQFFDNAGNVLVNNVAIITVNGKQYSVRTNDVGFASFQINFNPGVYYVVSTNPSNGYKLTTKFIILSTISSSNINQVYGQNKKFVASFFKSNGEALSKQYIKYKLNGKMYKVKTNSKGQISFSLKKFKKGTYKITCYNKDGLSQSFVIKIYKRKASTSLSTHFYTFFVNDNKQIKVKLCTALNDNSNQGKTVKIKINGKVYSKKTDSEGIVYLNLNSFSKGLYKVEYSYDGNNFFKSSKASNYVTILDNFHAKLSPKSTLRFGYGAGTLFKVALTVGGVPLVKRTVTLNIAGTKYTKTTDENGIVSASINLNIGKYNVSYNSVNQFNIDKTSGSCEIEVFKRSSSKLIWQCGSSYKDSAQKFCLLLTDNAGKPISGEIVELSIDSGKYFGVTSSSGMVIIKTSVALGKYKVSVKFLGSNNYLSSHTSKYVKVKVSQFGIGLNIKSSGSYSSSLLKSSSHCKVDVYSIKYLVKHLTKGFKSNVDKAKAIFNYVRDNIKYKFYYNSHHGATGTLKVKKGNCVDKSHLLVSMYRTAGFKTRYVHGKCKFNSGNVYGHVWTQVHIGKYWLCADSSNTGNSIGKITNWNIKSYKVHSKYSSLPF